MKLYIAKFTLRTIQYGSEFGPTFTHNCVRLVRANDYGDATKKLTAAVEVDGDYGVSIFVEALDMTETIE